MTVFIPDEKINEIKNAADIVDIVSEVVQLKKAGKNFSGLCPFHSEKTPSFTVSPEKQIFHCFGCGVGGNVFSFLMKHDGLMFPEAARRLAGRYGIDLPTRSLSNEDARRIKEKDALYDVNRLAADFYHSLLINRPIGQQALAYLTGRGISRETMEKFQLGVAPAEWDTLVKYLTRKQVPLQTAARAGLLRPRQSGGYYDGFRARIVFPIFNTGRQVIGFGGRALDDSPAKYLNTPETPIFNKGRSLYGLYLARQKCRETGIVFIVEGYMDAIALAQNDITNVVAVLGTSLTAEHIRLIKGYASKAVLVFDSDTAGLNAARRSIPIMNRDIEPRILILPQGHDPDSYIREFGPDAFNRAAETALNAMEFLIETTINAHGLAIEGKVHIISEMKTHLAEIDDSVARLLYVRQLSERTGVDESAILEKIREVAASPHSAQPHVNQAPRPAQSQPAGTENRIPLNPMEKKITAMMLQFPNILPYIKQHNVLDYFDHPVLKHIGERILEFDADTPDLIAQLLTNVADPDHRRLITSLAMQEEAWNDVGCENLIKQLLNRRKKTKNTLLEKIIAAEKSNNKELLNQLLEKKQRQLKNTLRNTTELVGGNPV